jgi:hypothetical protein
MSISASAWRINSPTRNWRCEGAERADSRLRVMARLVPEIPAKVRLRGIARETIENVPI